MATRAAFQLKYSLLVYNAFQISLSTYMFYEFFMSAYLAGYDLSCQPVDTSMNPLALRVCNLLCIIIINFFKTNRNIRKDSRYYYFFLDDSCLLVVFLLENNRPNGHSVSRFKKEK